MSDYIRKQDAINIANDWLLDCFKVQKQDRSCGLIRRLEDSPPASVVPVVRCKDCKYSMKWRPEESAKKFGQVYECVRGVFACPDANDFCSHGERKEHYD